MTGLLFALAVGGLELDWPDLPACPGAEEVGREVRGLVGLGLEEMTLEARVEIETAPWRAELRVFSRVGASSRTLQGESCTALAEAAAVVIALAAAEVSRTPESAPRRAPVRAGTTLRPVRVPWPWLQSLAIEVGPVTGASPGVTAQLQAGWSGLRLPWRLGVGGWFRGPRSLSGVDAETFGAGAWARSGRVLWARTDWMLDVHLGGELGGFFVSGPSDSDALWIAGGPGLGVERGVGPYWLRLSVEGFFPLFRPEVFSVGADGAGEARIYQPRPVSFRVFLSAGRRFR